jgi:UTP--glucose-1-phosphate uridylyltransferase
VVQTILVDFISHPRETLGFMKRIRKVIFPAGGLGTRFLPATKSMPKEMLPIVDKPLIHYAFEEAQAAGVELFVFVNGRNKTSIVDHFDRAFELEAALAKNHKQSALKATSEWMPPPGSFVHLRQREPLGLGHAVWCARHVIGDEPFAVILADDLVRGDVGCLKQMIDAHARVPNSNMAAVMEVPLEKTPSYGILSPDTIDGPLVRARSLIEKPASGDAPSTTAIIGRYILQPSIFSILEKQASGTGGEIQLTDALNSAIGTTDFYGYHFAGKRYDCGEVSGYIEANMAVALERTDIGANVREKLKGLLEG